MDIGSGIATCGTVLGVVAVAFKILPSKKSGDFPCADHSGVCKSIAAIEEMLKEVRTDIKHLIERK
jgi:hypothetical protein